MLKKHERLHRHLIGDKKDVDLLKIYEEIKAKEKKIKAYKHRDKYADLDKQIDEHKRIVEFIEKYKEEEKKKEQNKENL
jgi:predicted dinucleotide-utilizing enzyme